MTFTTIQRTKNDETYLLRKTGTVIIPELNQKKDREQKPNSRRQSDAKRSDRVILWRLTVRSSKGNCSAYIKYSEREYTTIMPLLLFQRSLMSRFQISLKMSEKIKFNVWNLALWQRPGGKTEIITNHCYFSLQTSCIIFVHLLSRIIFPLHYQ